MPFHALSPESLDSVLIKECFIRDENEVTRQCLHDEHPVKGITVRSRQPSCTVAIIHRDSQFLKTLTCNTAGNVKRHHFCIWQLPEAILGSDFPSRCRTDQDIVRLISHRTTGSSRQTFASGKPPEKGMSIEQELHVA